MEKPLDLTKPVQTRDGRPARIVCTDRKRENYPVLALVTNSTGFEEVTSHCADGKFYESGKISHHDLVNVPPKVVSELYRNVYPNNSIGAYYSTLSAAKREASPDVIGQIKRTTYDDDTFTFEKVED
jgi:hypothetical protein